LNQETVIKTRSLGKIYRTYRGFLKKKTIVALRNFNLEVKRGEIFGLLGLNAAGKTTVLKILLGFVYPTWGHFEVLGQRGPNWTIREKIGYLPEEPKLYDFLTVNEFLRLCGQVFNLDKLEIKKRTSCLTEIMEIPAPSQTKIRELSKGMNQRLALASALINDPQILLLDEPLSGLDPVGRKIVKQLILDFRKKGRTTFFSSHILTEVEQISDRIGILHQGKLLCLGETDKILMRHSSLEEYFLSKIEAAPEDIET